MSAVPCLKDITAYLAVSWAFQPYSTLLSIAEHCSALLSIAISVLFDGSVGMNSMFSLVFVVLDNSIPLFGSKALQKTEN